MKQGNSLGTKGHLCTVTKSSSCRRPCFERLVPKEMLFAFWTEYYSNSCHFFLAVYLLFPRSGKSGRHEFSPEGVQKWLILLGAEWRSVVVRALISPCSQIPRAEGKLVNGCPVERKSNFHFQVSHNVGPVGSCCSTLNHAVIYCHGEHAALKGLLSVLLQGYK